ncbi:hypothetical protein DPV78_010260 [Talaromyces pinophilus]|jgi:hypothetical protein|nr:hypothetical protein DPV78_010260 [Talaromyces pinophilus]
MTHSSAYAAQQQVRRMEDALDAKAYKAAINQEPDRAAFKRGGMLHHHTPYQIDTGSSNQNGTI